MQPVKATWLEQAWLATALFAALAGVTARAESADAERDRKRQYEEAARQGEEETQKKLPPQMAMHLMKAADHQQKAQQARQNKDEGTAQQEEQMAKMEQMKGQQLQQQINENKKSADQNKSNAKLLVNDEQGRKSSSELNHILVDQTRKNNESMGTSSAAPETTDRSSTPTKPEPPDVSPILEPQLARLDNLDRERQQLADRIDQQRTTEPKAAPPAEDPGRAWQKELAQVGTPNNGIGFNDAAPGIGATAGAGGGVVLGAAPQNRLLSAASDPLLTSEMPSALPALIRAPASADKKEKEAKDKDFWDAVDGKKKKKKKRGSLAAGTVRKGGAKGVVRVGKEVTTAAAEK